jgi:hypothetical protein
MDPLQSDPDPFSIGHGGFEKKVPDQIHFSIIHW